MMKLLIFLGGVACGFAACSFLSEEQRQAVRARTHSFTSGPRTRRLQSAAREATGSVADVAVTAVEGVAEKVTSAADDVAAKISAN
jgi:hypothetical protein